MNVATTNNKMKQVVFICVLIFISGHCEGQSGLISSKLDFGTSETTTAVYDSTLSSSLVKALVSLQHSNGPQQTLVSSKLDQNSFNLHSIAPLVRQNTQTGFTSLGVVCVDGNCNTADKKGVSNGENLSADILVQVVTNVENKKENKTVRTGEDSDVPVVVGYAGTNIKPNGLGLDSASRKIEGTQDVTITTGTDNSKFDYNYYNVGKENEVSKNPHSQFQHQVPYFEPTFNNHYFGESPPPQFVWYRRRNGHSSNAFVSPRPFKPYNQWQLKYNNAPAVSAVPNGWSQTTMCSCSNPGLNWYPSFGPHQPTPAVPINDKLQPLH